MDGRMCGDDCRWGQMFWGVFIRRGKCPTFSNSGLIGCTLVRLCRRYSITKCSVKMCWFHRPICHFVVNVSTTTRWSAVCSQGMLFFAQFQQLLITCTQGLPADLLLPWNPARVAINTVGPNYIRSLMKLFRTSSANIVEDCQKCFSFLTS